MALSVTACGSEMHGAGGDANEGTDRGLPTVARSDDQRLSGDDLSAAFWVVSDTVGRRAVASADGASQAAISLPTRELVDDVSGVRGTADWRSLLERGSEAGEGLIHGHVTHYGESYNGQSLGCDGAGVYSSTEVSIVAVSPARYDAWPCGTVLRVCGDVECIRGVRQDACPGCAPNQLDLSEAGIAQVCGSEEVGSCEVTIEVMP